MRPKFPKFERDQNATKKILIFINKSKKKTTLKFNRGREINRQTGRQSYRKIDKNNTGRQRDMDRDRKKRRHTERKRKEYCE